MLKKLKFKKMTIKGLVKFIAFILFSSVSAFLSLNMFFELGQLPVEKIAMIAIGVAIEALKIYLIIELGSSFFEFKYFFRARKRSDIHKLIMNDKLRRAVFLFVFYVIGASVSIGASLGFGLVTVDRYNQTHELVTHSVEIEAKSSEIEIYNKQIQDNEALIVSYTDQINATKDAIKGLPTEQDYYTRRSQYQAVIDKYTLKIIEVQQDNAEIREKIISIEKDISQLKIEEGKPKEGSDERSMYDLISESLNRNVSTSQVMFLMVLIIAIVIEIGMIATSPHAVSVDENFEIERIIGKIRKKREEEETRGESLVQEEVKSEFKQQVETPLRIEETLDTKEEVSKSVLEEKELSSFLDTINVEKKPIAKKKIVIEEKKEDPSVSPKTVDKVLKMLDNKKKPIVDIEGKL